MANLNWQEIARASASPAQIAILEMLSVVADHDEPARSPSAVARALSEPTPLIAYHFRMLRDRGLIELHSTRPRRGALEHLYVLTGLAAR